MIETLDPQAGEPQQATALQQSTTPQQSTAPPPPAASQRNEYDELLEAQAAQANQRATQAVAVSVGNDPDAVGRAQRLAAATGAGVPVALQNPVALQKALTLQQLQQRNLALHDPVLALQLSDPNFAAIAHDQVDNLQQTGTLFQRVKQMASDLSKAALFPIPGTPSMTAYSDTPTAKDLSSAYDQGQAQFERGMLAIKRKRGIATPDDLARLATLDAQTNTSAPPQTLGGQIFGGLSNMAGSMLPMVPRALGVGAAGAGTRPSPRSTPQPTALPFVARTAGKSATTRSGCRASAPIRRSDGISQKAIASSSQLRRALSASPTVIWAPSRASPMAL